MKRHAVKVTDEVRVQYLQTGEKRRVLIAGPRFNEVGIDADDAELLIAALQKLLAWAKEA